jgi:hypothetical protein
MKIHKGFSQTEIADRYYKIVHPERNYPRAEASKRFFQDKNIDSSIVKRIVKEITKEQLDSL